ncbi:MAG: ABC transporter permease [Sphingobacteriaceae bacterium]
MISNIFNDRNLNTIEIAVSSILANKMRATLTALGIIFGVAAIITMLAIGKGAEAEILEQLKATGVNNIMINAKDVVKKDETENTETTEKKPVQETKNYSKGLNLEDAASISQYINTIDAISTEAHFDTRIISAGRKKDVKLIGINDAYAGLNAITIAKGSLFNNQQNEKGLAVCIIGSDIKKYFFTTQDAVGNYIKCGTQWLKIVGVTAEKPTNKSAQDAFGIHNPNTDIYVPIQTLLLRFQNPAQIKPEKNQGDGSGRFIIIGGGVSESQQTKKSIHQVKRITAKVKSSNDLEATATLITKLLKRRHNNVQDFEVVVPELLLKQQQKTKEIFSLVLSVIAGISLLVGGIGIMNIMLASVLERTKEIGTRMAIGAQKLDIVKQFLFEAILISLSGGLIGILLGVFGAVIIAKIANIPTIISTVSIVISFVVSTGVGIIFGYSPAKKAAQQNPIESLRYE